MKIYYKCAALLPIADDEKWFLSISNFDNIEKIYQDWNSFVKNEKEWLEYGFLRIADMVKAADYLSVQTGKCRSNFSSVWIEKRTTSKLLKSIFELVEASN